MQTLKVGTWRSQCGRWPVSPSIHLPSSSIKLFACATAIDVLQKNWAASYFPFQTGHLFCACRILLSTINQGAWNEEIIDGAAGVGSHGCRFVICPEQRQFGRWG